MLTLRFAKSAIKSMLKMPKGTAQRMQTELGKIATDPTGYRGDWKPLQASIFWRLRVGDWRAICEIHDEELVLLVLKIAPRGDAYK